jgi:hypothetical protein
VNDIENARQNFAFEADDEEVNDIENAGLEQGRAGGRRWRTASIMPAKRISSVRALVEGKGCSCGSLLRMKLLKAEFGLGFVVGLSCSQWALLSVFSVLG